MIHSSLTTDLSTLTTISKLSLENLAEKAIYCMSHTILEAILSKETQCEIDIDIGKLYIKLEQDQIKYKFIPSKKLEETIAFTVKNKQSPLLTKLDLGLAERIEKAYRSVL